MYIYACVYVCGNTRGDDDAHGDVIWIGISAAVKLYIIIYTCGVLRE